MKHSVIAMVVLSAIAACSHLVPLVEVDAAEAKWKASGIQNYDFSIAIVALGGGAPCSPLGSARVDVQVRNGQMVKFGTCGPDAMLAQQFGSVPQIFATIRENMSERPPRYLVRFNSSLGYPEYIDANYSRIMTDSSPQYYVRDLREIW